MNQWVWDLFDLDKVLLGGQTFLWQKNGENRYIGVTQEDAILLEKRGKELLWQTYPVLNRVEIVENYFRTDHSISPVIQTIRSLDFSHEINEEYYNVRLLRQPIELTVLSFIMSSNKNIKAIRRSHQILRDKYGDTLNIDGELINLFPKTAVLAGLESEDLKDSGIGYRTKYILETSKAITEDPSVLSKSDDIYEKLMDLSGVGPKVADCILTFAYDMDQYSPVDVWTKRILVELFGLSPDMKYEEYRRWISQNFDGQAAWVFQILFEWYRARDIESKM